MRHIRTLSGITANFGSADPHEAEMAALGISPDEDQWPRYAFKIATGAGKRTLKRLLIHRSPLMPTGLLVFCLDYAGGESETPGGVFAAAPSNDGGMRGISMGMLSVAVSTSPRITSGGFFFSSQRT